MFSKSRNERRRSIGGRQSRKRRRDRRQLRRNRRQLHRNRRQLRRNWQWRHRNRRYRRERDPMLNSVLNGEWSNSVPGRKIPEGPLCIGACILKSSTVGSEISCWLMLEASTIKLSESGVPSKEQSQNFRFTTMPWLFLQCRWVNPIQCER